MNAQFKKGVLELCVLAFVEKQDCYGYELAKDISEHLQIAEGSVYPLLRRLTKEGYFQTYLAESTEGPPRKYYQLTKKGFNYKTQLENEWYEFSKSVHILLGKGVYYEEK